MLTKISHSSQEIDNILMNIFFSLTISVLAYLYIRKKVIRERKNELSNEENLPSYIIGLRARYTICVVGILFFINLIVNIYRLIKLYSD